MVNVGDLSVVVLLLADAESCLLGQLAKQSQGFTTAGGTHQRLALQGATRREPVSVCVCACVCVNNINH